MTSTSFNGPTYGLSHSVFLIGVGFLIGSPANAQIIPDDTLGVERSRVEVVDGFTERIEQGAIWGETLYSGVHYKPSTIDQGHFVNRERGGIPLNPDDPISSDLAWEDLYPPTSDIQAPPIAEANRWYINEAGQLVLRTTQELASAFACKS